MTGFGVDEAALEGAIRRLRDMDREIQGILKDAALLKPGELTANDNATNEARMEIQKRATGDAGSLQMVAKALREKLHEKAEAYQATLDEYRLAEDNATLDSSRIHRQA